MGSVGILLAISATDGEARNISDPQSAMPQTKALSTQTSSHSLPDIQLVDVNGSDDENSVEYIVSYQLAQAEEDVNDPLEGFNRTMFAFNELIYNGVLGPVADVYNELPAEARTMVSSFFSNLKEPLVFINDLLQGEIERAMNTFTRFALNSTFGFAGVADVATPFGIPGHDEDFGQTLAVWGVDDGPYLVLPILGPSNPRDAIGQYGVDTLINPVNIYLDNHDEEDLIFIRSGIAGFTDFAAVRGELIALEKGSFDFYAAVRSLYRQRRAAEISNGESTDLPAIPDFEFGDFPGIDDPDSGLGTTTPVSEPGEQLSSADNIRRHSYQGDSFVAVFQPALVEGSETDFESTAWDTTIKTRSMPR